MRIDWPATSSAVSSRNESAVGSISAAASTGSSARRERLEHTVRGHDDVLGVRAHPGAGHAPHRVADVECLDVGADPGDDAR